MPKNELTEIRRLIAAVTIAADPKTRHPRKRLAEIRAMSQGPGVNKLRLARILVEEHEREGVSATQRPMWRDVTRKIARETNRIWRKGRKKAHA